MRHIIGEKSVDGLQHIGWGTRLLRKAEEVAVEKYDCRRILVISGIGVRSYYRRQGYFRASGTHYMMKILDK